MEQPCSHGYSSFDIAFLHVIGRARFTSSFDVAFDVLRKAEKVWEDIVFWGPEAVLLGAALGRIWRTESKQLRAVIANVFDLTGDVSVSPVQAMAIRATFKGLGKKMRAKTVGHLKTISKRIVSRVREFYQKDENWVQKFDVADWEKYAEVLAADRIGKFIEKFPERVLFPEIERLVHLAEQNPALRSIDIASLKDRIERVMDPEFGAKYFRNVADLEAGNLWSFASISIAKERNITEYMLVSEEDQRTCGVCKRLHGKVFDVAGAWRVIQVQVDSVGEGQDVPLLQFPRLGDVDNVSGDEIRSHSYTPPFHGRCRCHIAFLGSRVESGVEETSPDQLPEMFNRT